MKHEIPMKRASDSMVVGTMVVTRVNDWSFVDEHGKRRVNPLRIDSIIVSCTNLKGETVGYASIPMSELEAG